MSNVCEGIADYFFSLLVFKYLNQTYGLTEILKRHENVDISVITLYFI